MSIYRFGAYGALLRDDHPLAVYVGKKRLSPPPELVWWFPWNWVLCVVLFPWALWRVAKDWKREATPTETERNEG